MGAEEKGELTKLTWGFALHQTKLPNYLFSYCHRCTVDPSFPPNCWRSMKITLSLGKTICNIQQALYLTSGKMHSEPQSVLQGCKMVNSFSCLSGLLFIFCNFLSFLSEVFLSGNLQNDLKWVRCSSATETKGEVGTCTPWAHRKVSSLLVGSPALLHPPQTRRNLLSSHNKQGPFGFTTTGDSWVDRRLTWKSSNPFHQNTKDSSNWRMQFRS